MEIKQEEEGQKWGENKREERERREGKKGERAERRQQEYEPALK